MGLAFIGSTSCNDAVKDQKTTKCLECTGCFGVYEMCSDGFRPTDQYPTWEAYQDSIIAKNGTWTDWCEKAE